MNAYAVITSVKKRGLKITVLTMFFANIFVLAGCAGNYGYLQRSEEVYNVFKTYRVLPDHKYYYTGPAGRPDAIIGIHSDYTLETTQWTQFDPSDGTLKTGVDSINFHYSTRVRNYPFGFTILDPDGRQVGVWYSIWDWTTVVMEEDNRIKVFPPVVEEPFGNGSQLKKMKSD